MESATILLDFVIANSADFDKCRLSQMRLCSLLLSLETPNAVRSSLTVIEYSSD